jgi:tetratricopeptide (TPR) repeat protein
VFVVLVVLVLHQNVFGFELKDFSKKPPSEQEILYKKIEALQSEAKYDSASIFINKARKIVLPAERVYTSLLLYRLNNFYHLGQFDSMKIVLPYFESRVDFYHYQYGFALLYRAIVLSNEGKYRDAIEIILKSIEEFEDDGDIGNQAIAYNSLGHYFDNLKDFEKAFESYTKAANLNKSIGNNIQLIKVYINLGGLFSGRNK